VYQIWQNDFKSLLLFFIGSQRIRYELPIFRKSRIFVFWGRLFHPAPRLRGRAFPLAKILLILARKQGNFNAFGRIDDFLFLRAESIFSFSQISDIIKVNPIP